MRDGAVNELAKVYEAADGRFATREKTHSAGRFGTAFERQSHQHQQLASAMECHQSMPMGIARRNEDSVQFDSL